MNRPQVRTITDLHTRLFAMLCAIRDAAPSESSWYLAYGTALGARRESDIISWDTDIDIYVMDEHLGRFLSALRDGLAVGRFRVQLPGDVGSDVVIPRVVCPDLPQDYVHVDIFPLLPVDLDRRQALAFDQKLRRLAQLHLLHTFNRNLKKRLPRRRRWPATALQVLLSPVPRRFFLDRFQRAVRLVRENCSGAPQQYYSVGGTHGQQEFMDPSWFEGAQAYEVIRGQLFPTLPGIHEYLRAHYGDYQQRPHPDHIAKARQFNEKILSPTLLQVQEEAER